LVKLSRIIALVLLLASSADAATYYVKSGGTGDGSSDANALGTIGDVEALSLSPGDYVLFKCGDTWAGEALNIAYSGTPENKIYIGAYYLNGVGSETIGASGNLPTFDGETTIPVDTYAGIVSLNRYVSHITLRHLRVENSHGVGFKVYDGVGNDIFDCQVDTCRMAGINWYNADDSLIEGNIVTNCSRRELEGLNWPGSVNTNPGGSNIIIRGNLIYKNFGEGIGIYKNSNNIIIEHNYVWGNKKANIYIEHAQNITIRYNVAHGITDTTYWRGPSSPPPNIWSGKEVGQDSYNDIENLQIYGNISAYGSAGIRLNGIGYAGSIDWQVYNNTCIDNMENYEIGPKISTLHSVIWRNNLSVVIDTGFADHSDGITGDWDYGGGNSSLPAALYGAHNAAPDASVLNTMSGWTSLTGGTVVLSDAAISSESSTMVGAAQTLASTYRFGLDETKSSPLTDVEIDRSLYAPWDIGALEYQGDPYVAPNTGYIRYDGQWNGNFD
jgi:hypothetical protein